MSVFKQANSKKYAGLTLALCFETLGDLEDPKLTEDEAKLLAIAGTIGANECGENLDGDEFANIVTEFSAWWMQNSIGPSDVVETMVAAGGTLKANWKTGAAGHVRYLKAVMVLGAVDGEITDTERQLPGMIAGLMGVDQATFSQAIKEFRALAS